MDNKEVLYKVYEVIKDRKVNPKEGSILTIYLTRALIKFLKKLGKNAQRL